MNCPNERVQQVSKNNGWKYKICFCYYYSVLIILKEKRKRHLEERSSSHPAFHHPQYVLLHLPQTTACNRYPWNSLLVFLSLIRRATGGWKHEDTVLGIEEQLLGIRTFWTEGTEKKQTQEKLSALTSLPKRGHKLVKAFPFPSLPGRAAIKSLETALDSS